MLTMAASVAPKAATQGQWQLLRRQLQARKVKASRDHSWPTSRRGIEETWRTQVDLSRSKHIPQTHWP